MVGHVPLPLHEAGEVYVPATQLSSRQLVSEPASPAHEVVVVPSQTAVVQTASPLPLVHAARTVPWGAPAIGTHLPFPAGAAPATSHASHWPLQAVSQQTPSAHEPDAHSEPSAQTVPSFFVQVPSLPGAAHVEPDGQAFSPAGGAQHTASTHLAPTAQSVAVVHLPPSPSSATHMPPLQ
jgi:hypothetical protein